jgi:hypothetical protein
MSTKILGDNITPKCEYCGFGTPAPDGEHILCEKAGLPSPDFSCKKFKYDPLKRTPLKPREMGEFTADDFKL